MPGGSWRDDRLALFNTLTVPTQVIRGGGVQGASERLSAFCESLPNVKSSALIPNGRAVLPYENARETAANLAEFIGMLVDD